MKATIPVIFRTFKSGGDVIALFPTIPWSSSNPSECQCYAHIGQHGAASVFITDRTRPATPEETALLLAELIRAGYDNLRPVKRRTAAHDRARLAAMA